MKRFFRHPEDIHLVFYHCLTMFAFVAAFISYSNPALANLQTGYDRIAFVAGCAIALGIASGVDVAVAFHNHIHVPLFDSGAANRWLGRLWTFSSGWPSFFFSYAHSVHHANLLTERDWTLPRQDSRGRSSSIVAYSFSYWPFGAARQIWRRLLTSSNRRLAQRAWFEFAIFLILWSIPFFINLEAALFVWLLPQWIGNVFLVGSGMHIQHTDCDPPGANNARGHSNSSLNLLFNLTMFNIGFHAAHHESSQTHWASLPAESRKMEGAFLEAGYRLFKSGHFKKASILSSPWLAYSKRWEKMDTDRVRSLSDRPPDFCIWYAKLGTVRQVIGRSWFAFVALAVVSASLVCGSWVGLVLAVISYQLAKRIL